MTKPPISPAAPITLETFFRGHHVSNWDKLYEDEGKNRVLKASAFLDHEAIAAEEARLGIALPDTLRALYLKQNGGSVGDDVRSGKASARGVDDLMPFSGYGDLLPLTRIGSLRRSIEAYASFEAEPERFPRGAARMIVLARWGEETLFLDYRTEGVPRIGFYDFDLADDLPDGTWEAGCAWWPDFDAFFASLYRLPRELA